MASIFSRFFGRTVSEAAGVAAGIAVASPLRPVVQLVENETWAIHPDKPVPATIAAAIVAEDVQQQSWGEQQASWTGFSAGSFAAMLGEALNAPGLGVLFEAFRRDLIDEAAFTHGLRKAKLETRWDAPLIALKQRLLEPAELANARQQGFIDVARQHSEAALQGVDAERADIQFELAGLPPGVETALEMLRRGIITSAEFAEIVRTGHTKTKWTTQLEAMQARVLGASTYAGLHLRGWIDEAAMIAGGALTGYSQTEMDLLYKEHGRPATGRQVFIGLRRGGSYNGPTTGIDQAFIDAIRQSNIRPEWTNLLWAQRFTYPSAFVLRALAQGGDLTQAETEKILLYEGWEPGLAATVSTKWAGGTTATSDPLARSARVSLLSALHKAYVLGDEDEAAARNILTAEAVDATTQDTLIQTWNRERSITRRELTPSQLKKAMAEGITNPATGAPFTKDEVVAELVLRGYSSADANVFLET
jgi:hypothetical protein